MTDDQQPKLDARTCCASGHGELHDLHCDACCWCNSVPVRGCCECKGGQDVWRYGREPELVVQERRGAWAWRCEQCGALGIGLSTELLARTEGGRHRCSVAELQASPYAHLGRTAAETVEKWVSQEVKAERDRIVTWLRSDQWGDWSGTYASDVLADRIEKGAHHEQ